MKMRTNTETLNKNANTNILSVIEDLKQLISELEHPKYRDLMRFAVPRMVYMSKLIAVMLLILGTSTVLMAQGGITVPEIDPTTAMAAVALLAGAALVIRGRRKK
jgi:hypothetical protein